MLSSMPPLAGDPPFEWKLRRSTRATRIRVTVDADGVVVTVPQSASERTAARAVAKLEDWILERLAERAVDERAVERRGAAVPWLGELTPLVTQAGRKVAVRRGGVILVPEGDHIPALESLFRREARRHFTGKLDLITRACGNEWSSLRIGDMKTRWGSCSPGGRMSFSWRLMLAPADVLETIVWHEVCHIDEPSHSKRFWRLMDDRRPGHREHARWLADNGRTLVLGQAGESAGHATDHRGGSNPEPAPEPITPTAGSAAEGEPGEQLRLTA